MHDIRVISSNIIKFLKRWGIYPLGAYILMIISEQIIIQIVDPIINKAFNISTAGVESLKQIDYSWLAPVITVVLVGLIASWQVNRIKKELNEWKNDCKMLFDWREELKLEIQHLQEELQRVYERDPSLNPNRNVTYSLDVILRPSTPRDTQLMNIVRKLQELKK